MQALIAALGPQLVTMFLPFLVTEIVGRKVKQMPRTWLPWFAMVAGALTTVLPGMPASVSPLSGLQGGAFAVAANEALKAFRAPRAIALASAVGRLAKGKKGK